MNVQDYISLSLSLSHNMVDNRAPYRRQVNHMLLAAFMISLHHKLLAIAFSLSLSPQNSNSANLSKFN